MEIKIGVMLKLNKEKKSHNLELKKKNVILSSLYHFEHFPGILNFKKFPIEPNFRHRVKCYA